MTYIEDKFDNQRDCFDYYCSLHKNYLDEEEILRVCDDTPSNDFLYDKARILIDNPLHRDVVTRVRNVVVRTIGHAQI